MATMRDYYMILGLPPGASTERIKQAFHELAMRHHPDRAGTAATSCFQEIVEAYAVLSNDRARARYDRQLERRTAPAPPAGDAARDMEPRRPRSAPRHEREWPAPRACRRRSRQPAGWPRPEPFVPHRPEPESLFGNRPPASSWGRPARTPEVLTVNVRLSPTEARLGARVLLPVPVQVLCPACRAVDVTPLLGCRYCGGHGYRRVRHEIALDLPPGLDHGDELELPLAGPGLDGVSMRLRVSISAS